MDEDRRRMEERHFVEDVALFFEEMGFPRMAGRILGWLLICDPPEQSAGQLAGVLQASKGSLSTMTRLLIQIGLVERVGLPGERRDHFRIRPGAWPQLLRVQTQVMTGLHQVVERGLGMLADEDPERRRRLEEAHDLYAFLERELPRLLQQWEQERALRQSNNAGQGAGLGRAGPPLARRS
jgi:DNA-binding transcriptional regulator GbsR (MarR family)